MLKHSLGIELATESLNPGARRPAIINKEKAQSIGAFWNYSNYAGGVNPYKGMEMKFLPFNRKQSDETFIWSYRSRCKGLYSC